MDSDRAQGRRYRLVLRGELGEPFGFLFEGMQMDRVAGTTVLTGRVIDQAHLHGLIQRTQELGLELISIGPMDEEPDETERPRADRAESRGAAEREVVRMTQPKDSTEVVCRGAQRAGAGEQRGADDECSDGWGCAPKYTRYTPLPAGVGAGPADSGGARCAGEGGAGRGAAGEPCGVRPGAGPARPDRPAGGAGEVAGAGAGADPAGPDDGLPVHVLPRRGAADGQRPFPYSGVRAGGAGVRGCAPVELRHLRLRRAAPGLRRQRLR